MTLSASIKKEERFSSDILSFQLRKLEKEEQIESKISRRKEIRITAEINKIQNGKIEKINKTKSWSFKRSIKSISL